MTPVSLPELSAFGISTRCYGSQTLATSHLDELHGLGLRHIELFADSHHFDYRDRARRREISDWFATHTSEAPSLHLPSAGTDPGQLRVSPLASEQRDRQTALDEIKRALEINDDMPVAWVVVHLGVPHQPFTPVLFDYAYALVDLIRTFAGVDVLIETLQNEISSPKRIREFLTLTEVPEVGICYDVGHGHLEQMPVELDRVRAIHLNDNDAARDDHLWPFMGTIDWPSLAGEFADGSFLGPFILEGADTNLHLALDGARRLEALISEARTSREGFDLRHGMRTSVR